MFNYFFVIKFWRHSLSLELFHRQGLMGVIGTTGLALIFFEYSTLEIEKLIIDTLNAYYVARF